MQVHSIAGRGFSSNIFLVEGSPSFIVDAGLDDDAERVASFVKNKGVSPEALVLTHRHVDHVGGAARLARLLDISAYSTPQEAEPVCRGDGISTGALLFGCKLEKLDVKDIRDWDCNEWSILKTPGHTEGSFCLYFQKDGTLISGDTVFADGGVGRWDLPTGSLKELVQSLNTLANIPVNRLYPGHGRWVESDASYHIAMSQKSLGGYR
ncbi:MAG TPA: MBL fold metallo-hydrolase [Euryarchaeota archaeon]|nr:MBL fold metallo-hydrolase [Euryarchaeota archaeon]